MTYVHHTYTLLKEEVRLVTLWPADESSKEALVGQSSSDRIRCTTHRYTLGDCPAYTALSYHWGSNTSRATITVNDHDAHVTPNLETALRHLRCEVGPPTLWIDDLCIDQHNNTEKSEQVSQMRDIYQRAAGVISWLGPAADQSDIAMQWIETFGHRSWELGIGTRPDLQLMQLLKNAESQSDSKLSEFLKDLSSELSPLNPRHAQLVPALRALFTRPYWSRIWVVQEVAMGAKVTFVCGQKSVTEEMLHHASRLVRNFNYHHQSERRVTRNSHKDFTSDQANQIIDPGRPINLLKVRRASGPLPLIYLLRSLRHFQASDPRDKIFALLGIASDRNVLGLYSDYRKTCEQVYIEAALVLLKHGWLEVLSLNGSVKSYQRLPSWAPDWSRPASPSYLQQRALVRASRPLKSVLQPTFSASKHIETKPTPILHVTEETSHTLCLSVIFVDSVEQVGRTFDDCDVTGWLQELKRLSELSKKTIHLSDIWRCAAADQEIRQASNKPRMSSKLLIKISGALNDRPLSSVDATVLKDLDLGDYCLQLQAIIPGRRPFLTASGLIAIGPKELEPQDHVVVVPGADAPFIVRETIESKTFRLKGDGYVHGVMDGEIRGSKFTLEDIKVI